MDEREAAELVTELYASLYSLLLRFAAHLTGSLECAEDVVQETFTRLYREFRLGHGISNPKAWAFSVVRREAGNQHRQYCPTGSAGPPEMPEQHAPPTDWLDADDQLGRLLSVLSAREAEVVLLRLGNLKYREIGAQLGISVKSVGTLLARALRKMRRALSEGFPREYGADHVEVESARLKTLQ
jgi:RNA polymerase sigma-70 factor (ECF subfamily)